MYYGQNCFMIVYRMDGGCSLIDFSGCSFLDVNGGENKGIRKRNEKVDIL